MDLSAVVAPVEGGPPGGELPSMPSLIGLLPMLWRLAPWAAGLMVLRCLPHTERLRAAWRAGRRS